MGEREVCGVGYAECGVRLVCGGVHAVEHDVAGGVVSPAFFVTCELVVGLGFDLWCATSCCFLEKADAGVCGMGVCALGEDASLQVIAVGGSAVVG